MSYNITIIGAGIVGLATAYKASLKFPDSNIIILEKKAKLPLTRPAIIAESFIQVFIISPEVLKP